VIASAVKGEVEVSVYVSSRRKFIASLRIEGIDEIRAHEFTRLWEYEANRRHVNHLAAMFWQDGREFVDGLLERDRLTLIAD
jgi:RPA family protein